jgi:hypothetical protein
MQSPAGGDLPYSPLPTAYLPISGIREVLLKARQFGFSTLILGLFFLATINHPHTSTVVVAHDADSTERMFQIVQRFYESLPASRRAKTRYANRREYLWPEIDSSFFVGTAGAKDFGRGSTINNAHLSEVAFWPDAEDLVAGLLQAVPADGNVIIETTANGLGNWSYKEYQAARRRESVFVPRFYAWFLDDSYRLPSHVSEGLAGGSGPAPRPLPQRGRVPGSGGLLPPPLPRNAVRVWF